MTTNSNTSERKHEIGRVVAIVATGLAIGIGSAFINAATHDIRIAFGVMIIGEGLLFAISILTRSN